MLEKVIREQPGHRGPRSRPRSSTAARVVETVIGIQALKDSKEWSVEEIDKALSEEALTASVMSRYHVNNQVKRELGAKLGKLQVA